MRPPIPADADLSHISPDLRPLAVPIGSLTRDPQNARLHPDANLTAVENSLRKYGMRKPLVVNTRSGFVTEAGNGTLEAALSLGWEYVAASFEDDDPVTAIGYALADNQTAMLAEWSDPILASLLVGLEAEGEDPAEIGFDEAYVRDLLARVSTPDPDPPAPPEPQTDRAAELQKVWQTAAGQVWEIPSMTVPGRSHRVLCGDCRNPDDVARLIAGARVNVAFTSPPYASQRKYDESSGFKPIHPDEFVDWFEAVQANVRAHLADDGSWFVNIKEHCEDGQRHLYVKDLTIAHVRRWGWRFVDELIWKHHGFPGEVLERFRNAWEPIFHYTGTAARAKCRPANVAYESDSVIEYRTETRESMTFDANNKGGAQRSSGMALPRNVLEISNGAATSIAGHAATFPCDLPAWFIKAYSDPGDAIYDPFVGSGTVIIAAEREGRIGYGIEISAKYLSVVLQRAKDANLEPRQVTP